MIEYTYKYESLIKICNGKAALGLAALPFERVRYFAVLTS